MCRNKENGEESRERRDRERSVLISRITMHEPLRTEPYPIRNKYCRLLTRHAARWKGKEMIERDGEDMERR